MTTYNYAVVDGHRIFYREAGSRTIRRSYCFTDSRLRPTCFAISSLFSRIVITSSLLIFPALDFRRFRQKISFATALQNLANVISRFTEIVGSTRFAIYVFDYGAPVGFRLAVAQSRKDHRRHLAERQRLRRGTE